MNEQSKILAQLHELIMEILKSGMPTEEEANKIDYLEGLLHQQKCFQKIDASEHANQGEEIASLFFTKQTSDAIDKMCECKITPEDFFGFVQYHYDEDHKDEEKIVIFTEVFMNEINSLYTSKC